MDLPMTLSLEQQFNLKVYEEQVRTMSAEQSQTFLLEVMRQLMVKENIVKHLMKNM
jgi:Phycobilisome degradation protein nblA